ncbi:MAG: hypothetical protein AAGF95_14375 [Chloroflexota bacterium]
MDTRELLYRILFRGLVEIRAEAYTIQNKQIFFIADLLHQLPLDLASELSEDASFDDVLKSLQERSHEKGSDQWLTQVITEVTQYRQMQSNTL